MAQNKFYAVVRGKNTGVFNSWKACQEQVVGFSGAIYKGFPTEQEAWTWYNSQTGDGPLVEGNKIYAVAKGKMPGIFYTWVKCLDQVKGFSNALYKSFPNTEEGHVLAAQFLAENLDLDSIENVDMEKPEVSEDKTEEIKSAEQLEREEAYKIYLHSIELSKEEGHVVVYVDGSFGIIKDPNNKKKIIEKVYSGAGIVIKNGQIVHRIHDTGNDQNLAAQQNVAGEMVSAIRAVEYVTKNMTDMKKMTIIYDYKGIEYWSTGVWKRNNPYTEKYHKYMTTKMKQVAMDFIHCNGHRGNPFNEEADRLAGYAKDCYKANTPVNMDYFLTEISYFKEEYKESLKNNK